MRHKDFRDSDKNVSSRNSMHLPAKKVYKRCIKVYGKSETTREKSNATKTITTPRLHKKDGVFYCSICNPKVIQISLKAILCGKAGIHKETFFVIPFLEAAIVEQFQVILDDEWDDVVLQALLKKD